MHRFAVASFLVLIVGCAKHVTPVDQASLIGSWTSHPKVNPKDWDRWTFRSNGTAELRTHFQFTEKDSSKMVFDGPYQLTNARLTVKLKKMDITIGQRDLTPGGDISEIRTGNVATFENLRFENGNLVSKNLKKGGDSVLYPWRG